MGNIYNRFKELKVSSKPDWFMRDIGLVKFSSDNINYEICFTRKRADMHTHVYCSSTTIELEHRSILSLILNKPISKRDPLISIAPTEGIVRIVLISGNPGKIHIDKKSKFRSFDDYDEGYVNVISETDFKKM